MNNGTVLFIAPEAMRIIESFACLFDVRFTIFSLEIDSILKGFPRDVSKFCSFVRHKMLYKCLKQDKMMCEKCVKKTNPIFYQCFAGPAEIVIPLILEEKKLAGYAMLGQFRTLKKLPREILTELKNVGGDTAKIKSSFLELPYFDKSSAENLLCLFKALVNYLVSRRLISERRLALIEDIMRYIEENITENITIESAAKVLHRSGSAIYHSVKRNLGFSFKRLVTLKRIRHFENLASLGTVSIKEAAALSGYCDQLYFSRVYKKHRGITPTVFMNLVNCGGGGFDRTELQLPLKNRKTRSVLRDLFKNLAGS